MEIRNPDPGCFYFLQKPGWLAGPGHYTNQQVSIIFDEIDLL